MSDNDQQERVFRFNMSIDITAVDEVEARKFLANDINGIAQCEILDAQKWEIVPEGWTTPVLEDGIVSAEKKQQYIDCDGVSCPFCGSADIEAGGPKVSDYSEEVFEKTTCNSCGKKWKDIYQIVNIVEQDEDEKDSEEED